MCNRYALQDWTMFAAGDVPRWRRRRMARHLAGCADCRAASAFVQSVWNAAQPFAIEEINPTMYSQIQSAIAAQNAPHAARPRFSVCRLPRAAVFGTLGLTAAFALCAAPFLMTRPLPAFADVERAMLAVKTARYHTVMSFSFGKPRFVYTDEWDSFIRFAPAAWASRGVTRNLMDAAHPKISARIGCEDRFGYLNYSETMGPRYEIDRNPPNTGPAGEEKTEAALRRQMWDLINAPSSRQKDHLTFGPNDTHTDWQGRRVTVAGQPFILFERQREYAKLPSFRGDMRARIQDSVWVDPQTNLVVREETHCYDVDQKREENSTVSDQFRYDENIPDSAFQVPMPPQAHLAVVDHDRYQRDPTKRKAAPQIAEVDRAAIQKLIAASDLAWSQGDFAKFAALWDFDYLSNLYANSADRAQFPAQRSRHFENLVMAQRGVWKSWHTGINKITPVSIVSGVTDAFCVETFSNLRWKGLSAMRENEYTYYVRNTPNGWRVLDWNPSAESLRYSAESLRYPGDRK